MAGFYGDFKYSGLKYGRFEGHKYGRILYGDGKKYGVSQTGLSWQFQVDWDNDGDFGGANEAYYLRDLSWKRGRENYMRTDGSGFEEIRVGKFSAVLDDAGGRYNPYNTSSELYPNVRPGMKVIIKVMDNPTHVKYDLFVGYITDIQPILGADERVRITGVDGIYIMKQQDITDVLRSSQDVSDLMAYILTAASWSDGSSIESDSSVVPYWWTEDESAWDALWKLASAYLGTVFVDNLGQIQYFERLHNEYKVVTLTSEKLRKQIVLPQPWEVIRNYVRVAANSRQSHSDEELWRLVDTTEVLASETIEIWAEYTYNNERVPAANVVDPVATTDYTMNTHADGGGSNLTASFDVTAYKYASRAKLEITNNSAFDGYITLLKIRGDALQKKRTWAQKEDSTSQGLYGVRRLTLNNEMLQDVGTSIDYATLLKTKLADPILFPIVEMEGRADVQYLPDLFDTVMVYVPERELGENFDVMGIESRWMRESGQAVMTRFWLQPAYETIFWEFPAQVGVSTIWGF